MKIIHITFRAEEYGIGSFLNNLLAFQKNNYKNLEVAVTFNAPGPNEADFLKMGINVYSLDLPNAKDIRAFLKFLKIFKNYDIINLHSYTPWAFFAGLFLGKKIVYTFHGALGLRGKFQDIFVKVFHKLFINRYCKKITFASNASLQRYLNGFHCRMNPKKMVVFPYGMQIDRIKAKVARQEIRKQLELGNQFVIGTAARMDPNKRIERLLEAFAQLPDSGSYKLVIMGEGDQKYKKFLQNVTQRLKINENVLWLGFRKDVWDVINTMDLFVLPSQNEPFGLALLEAMALGIPCAVFNDGGGTVDIIGDSGFVVKDSKELSEVFLKLKSDPELTKSMSSMAKIRALEFDIKHTAEKLFEIYEEALDLVS